MKLIRNIKRLFNADNVEFIDNTEKKIVWLEASTYLLVEKSGEKPMMFTNAQIKIAQDRAERNKEDL
jgi:hypothetical protein